MSTIKELGPRIDAGQTEFKRKCRKLQAFYREVFLKEKCGRGPRENDDPLASMIQNGEKTGKNFLTKEIYDHVKKRLKNQKSYETFDEYRLYNNMLSSQPLCFNLFVPLKNSLETYPELSEKTFKEIFPDLNIKTIDKIEIEYIPDYYEELINDKTAFDAFIEYTDEENQKGIIGIETKYTEKLGDNIGKNTEINFDFNNIFTEKALNKFKRGECDQLTRNILLTESYRTYNNFDQSLSIVLSPKKNKFTNQEIEDFSDNFINQEIEKKKLRKIDLETFTETAKNSFNQEYYSVWINNFYNRYLNFDLLDILK